MAFGYTPVIGEVFERLTCTTTNALKYVFSSQNECVKFLKTIFLLVVGMLLVSCVKEEKAVPDSPYILVLGIAQDAGYPQAGCYAEHCMRAWNDPELRRSPTSFALIDPQSKKKWLFEATPDIKEQLFLMEQYAPDSIYQLGGVFLTHGHMGHYTGLMHFGREVMGTKGVPVYAMPRMKEYLSNNGPWSQLVDLKNITLSPMSDSTTISLSNDLTVMPFSVPHRDEFTEAVGYQIKVGAKRITFIPDIDKWTRWDVDIKEVILQSDIALLDATFFDGDELPGRNMAEIPHPFVEESLDFFSDFNTSERGRVHFIHFNHSNPLLIEGSSAQKQVETAGYNIAKEGAIIPL